MLNKMWLPPVVSSAIEIATIGYWTMDSRYTTVQYMKQSILEVQFNVLSAHSLYPPHMNVSFV